MLIKKITSAILAVTMVAAMSTTVFAEEEAEVGITSSPVNSYGEKPISTHLDVSSKTRTSRSVQFSHTSGFEYSANGSSGEPDERVWGRTFHIDSSTGESVDGYTRARYENGTQITADSDRLWSMGISKATSGWLDKIWGRWTGHTYYGN